VIIRIYWIEVTSSDDPAASAGPLERVLAARKHATVANPASETAIRFVNSERGAVAEILVILRLPERLSCLQNGG